jgi:hypothetical protein
LKKEPKNFCSFGPSLSGKAEAKTDKSFLLLFFKKEDFLSQSNSSLQADRIFFEKKNQKTFATLASAFRGRLCCAQ